MKFHTVESAIEYAAQRHASYGSRYCILRSGAKLEVLTEHQVIERRRADDVLETIGHLK